MRDTKTAVLTSQSDKRSRLIYVLYCGNLNGTEKMALATSSAVSKNYTDVLLLAPPGYGAYTLAQGAKDFNDIRVETFHGSLDLFKRLFQACLHTRRIDFIAASVSQSLMCFLVSTTLFRRGTHLHVVHGGNDLFRDLRQKKLLNWLPMQFIAVSQFIKRALIANGVRESKIVVIENFLLDMEKGHSENTQCATKAVDRSFRYRVVLVARADTVKRIDLVIQAARLGLLGDILVEILGDGPLLETYRSQSADLKNLVFHGYENDVSTRIKDADALLHTCPVEAFGLVVLEAFGAKIPVVVPDAGGTAEIVIDRINGRQFVANDVHSMCEVLREVLKMSDAARHAMVETAYNDLQVRYSLSRGTTAYAKALGLTP